MVTKHRPTHPRCINCKVELKTRHGCLCVDCVRAVVVTGAISYLVQVGLKMLVGS